MSAEKKSREFCIIGEDGEPDDAGLHAEMLPELADLVRDSDKKHDAGPGLHPEDEDDVSDLEDLVKLADEMAPGESSDGGAEGGPAE